MHCEKNLCENLLRTLLGMNDSPGSRVDAKDLGIREEIWLKPPQKEQDEYYMPHAPYVFRAKKRTEFVGIVHPRTTWVAFTSALWMGNCNT